MRTLIVGVGALGGTIGTRALHAGMPVWLATRTEQSAAELRASGLRVSGVGGEASAASVRVAALAEYAQADKFELILLATKAHDALESAPALARLLLPGGTLLCIQNGGVSQLVAERLGEVVLGGLSNLGATMVRPGVYEQRNAGHLLIGEVAGGLSERAVKIAAFLEGAIGTRPTANLAGAIWSKLLLNCSVTTLGALAGQPMRQYMRTAAGPAVFQKAYAEALSVAVASGTRPERMIVDPIPPAAEADYARWIEEVTATYGDLKPSMLQDFERGRRTEIDFINGYVAQLGQKLGVAVPVNAAITATAHRIERGQTRPHPDRLAELLQPAV
jgi:2-dehydropantoate 2-reductase